VIKRRSERSREREAANGWCLDLSQAVLKRAALMDVHLERAILSGAHLERAILRNAHLAGAILMRAHLERTILLGTHLAGAILGWAHLEGADLRGAPGLSGDQLRFAYGDATTRLPKDVDRPAHWLEKESVDAEARMNLSQELRSGTAEEINKREIFRVDVAEFGGKSLQIPAYQGITVGDFLDAIWFELSKLDDVPPFQYNTSWVLENANTGQRYENAGTHWAFANGLDRDNRLLKDLAITPNVPLKAVDMRRSTKPDGGGRT
jgi:Pentapeptide repeats (8 copies)